MTKKVCRSRFVTRLMIVTMLLAVAGVCSVLPSFAAVEVERIEPLKKVGAKVGAITSCSKLDYSWGTSNYRAIKMLEEEFGAQVTFLDTVSMVDQAKIFKDFADADFDLMIGWGYEFLDSANIVAEAYPNKPFVITCAPHPGSSGFVSNLASMYYTEEEAGYLAGVMAARLSKTKKVGFVTGTDIPCVAKTLNAYRLGAYRTDPKMEIYWAFLGSWADVAKERELTNALIDVGVDVVFALWVGLAAADVCEERGIPLIGSQYLDEYKPDTVVAAHFEDMIASLREVYELLLRGEFEGVSYQMTMNRGITDLRVNKKLVPKVIPYEVVDELGRIREAIERGNMVIPRLIRVLPKTWPNEAVPDYESYLEPGFQPIYVYK